MMKDRVPTYPGRVKLAPVNGQANTYDMTRADEPVVEGTLLNKASLLSDETAGLYGLGGDAVPNDVLKIVRNIGAYGTCSTSAGTTNKIVSVSAFVLLKGAHVAVAFTNAVQSGAKLNVNNTGAKNIRWRGNNVLTGMIKAGDTVEFVYTGSYWDVLSIDTVSYTPPTFENATWAEIGAVAAAGMAPNVWSRGDEKSVTLTTGETKRVRIEDFNHDDLTAGGKAPITLSFMSLFEGFAMSGNKGGWTESTARKQMDTYFNRLPTDLQDVIKYVNKKTSAGNMSTTIQTTSDRLWIFSEVEVSGAQQYSVNGEGTVYPLFTDNASRIRDSGWWLRSPRRDNTSSFCAVSSDGRLVAVDGTWFGLGAAFCI